MDFQDETPPRFWVTHPEKHPELTHCARCKNELDRNYSIPVSQAVGPLCAACASDEITNHPVTPEYMTWVLTGDPRWWSMWLCNHCMEVDDGEEGAEAGAEEGSTEA